MYLNKNKYIYIIYIYLFFGSQMTGLVGCINLDCTSTRKVRRLLAAVHMMKVRIYWCEGKKVE